MTEADNEMDTTQNPPSTADAHPVTWLVVIAAVLLFNSLVFAYGFWQLRGMSETLRWMLLVAVPEAAHSTPQRPTVTDGDSSQSLVSVELYSDFDCRFCRASVSTIDSARKMFGDSVAWRYRYTADPRSDLSMRAAIAGVCLSDSGGPWGLYSQLDSEDEWTALTLDEAIASLGVDHRRLEDCMDEEKSIREVWSDIFRASALGRTNTPTVVVDGIEITGRIRIQLLAQLIRYSIARRQPHGTSN